MANEIGNTPKNLNHLREKNFISKMAVAKLPNIDFFVTTLTMPGFNVGEIPVRSLNKLIPVPSNSLDKDPLTVQFIIDEDMRNWLELYDWMMGMTYPESFQQSKNWVNDRKQKELSDKSIYYSDLQITILKNSMMPNLKFTFHNAFPTTLDGFDLTIAGSDEPLVASSTFTYSHVSIENA